jgi:hypothetical protein
MALPKLLEVAASAIYGNSDHSTELNGDSGGEQAGNAKKEETKE